MSDNPLNVLQPASLLSDAQVEDIHETSLEILAEVGLVVRNPKARKRFARAGCPLDEDRLTVRLPRQLIAESLALVPPRFTFRGRDPAFDRTIPDDAPVIATTSSAPDVIDPVSGEARRARSDDIARIAHLVNELPGYDVFSISTLAGDAPEGQFSLSRFYPALKNTLKPVRTAVLNPAEAQQIIALGELIAGSPGAFWERPFITFGACNIVSPLTMDVDSTEMWMFAAEKGLAIYGAIAPIGGLSMPLPLAGAVALSNAEWLAQMTLAQLSQPGTPLIYIHLPVVADLRGGAYAAGGVETGILQMALSRMARFYRVPSGSYAGQTNAKLSDAQAGFEKGIGALAALLGGTDYIKMGGLLDALMTFDYGQLVIDGEIALMMKRVADGVTVDAESLSLAAIREVGAGGSFIDRPETLAGMTSVAFLPEIADRERRESWQEQGAVDAHGRALTRVREILSTANEALLGPETDARIRSHFAGLVAGDSFLPEAWGAPPEVRRRTRRVNRRRRA